MSDRHELPTADLIVAYRRQSRAERSFREMKDPAACSLRPQSDQELQVHAFRCVVGSLLLNLFERRARQAGVPVRNPRALLPAPQAIREVMVIEPSPRGRPRVRRQPEELSPEAEPLASCGPAVGIDDSGLMMTAPQRLGNPIQRGMRRR